MSFLPVAVTERLECKDLEQNEQIRGNASKTKKVFRFVTVLFVLVANHRVLTESSGAEPAKRQTICMKAQQYVSNILLVYVM